MRFFEENECFWECYDDTNIRKFRSFKEVIFHCINANFYPTLIFYKKCINIGRIEIKYKRAEELNNLDKNIVLSRCFERDEFKAMEKKTDNHKDNSFRLLKDDKIITTNIPIKNPSSYQSSFIQNKGNEFKETKYDCKEKNEELIQLNRDNINKFNNKNNHHFDFISKTKKTFQENNCLIDNFVNNRAKSKWTNLFNRSQNNIFDYNENKLKSKMNKEDSLKYLSSYTNSNESKINSNGNLQKIINNDISTNLNQHQVNPINRNLILNEEKTFQKKRELSYSDGNDLKSNEETYKGSSSNNDHERIVYDNKEAIAYSDTLLFIIILLISVLLMLLCF